MVFKRMEQRRAERKAAYPHEDEPVILNKTTGEPVQAKEGSPADKKATKTKGFASVEEREEAIAKAEADAKAKAEAEPVPLTPSPEPPVLPKWKNTVVPTTPGGDEAKTVGDWIIQGITKIVDEHKLVSLTAWRDVSGNVVVQYVEDPRAMYALRKDGRK